MIDYTFGRAWTERPERNVDYSLAPQGKVFWLPAKEELPERAVKRAHGKGAVEEGIYHHPVVAISQPSDDSETVHFHLITSLQGKRLDQLYAKANEFHASRRSWYLPISPTPDHPDALSKKTKKRFPTLQLVSGATLRWDSYVNIRHVYKIDIALLKPYTNPNCASTDVFRFERESLIRMLAKSKTLTIYEPGPQYVGASMVRSNSESSSALSDKIQHVGIQLHECERLDFGVKPVVAVVPSNHGEVVDFRMANTDGGRVAGQIPKVPPDEERRSAIVSLVQEVVRPVEQLVESISSLAVVANKRAVVQTLDAFAIRQPLDRAWRDFKGFTAVIVASV